MLKRKNIAFVVLSLLGSSFCFSAITADPDFCQRAQQIVADTTLLSTNTSHTDFQKFVKSKAFENPLQTQQFVDYQLINDQVLDMPVSISCKLKTAERINHGLDLRNNENAAVRAKNEGRCKQVNEESFQAILSDLSDERREQAKQQFVFDNDVVKWIGPFWIRPWPYQMAYLGEDGKTHIRSKSLHVEFSMFIPMPDKFKGTHYCHLVAPEYLKALVVGSQKAIPLIDE